MNSKHVYYFLMLLLLFSGFLEAQTLKVFPSIPGRTASDKYVCKVREVGNPNWQNAFVIQSKSYNNPSDVPNGDDSLDNGFFHELEGWSASYIAFESDYLSAVEVEIAKKDGSAITKVPVVRPAGDATARISGGKAYITFTKKANVNVDIDGQMEEHYTGDGYTDNGGAPVHTLSIFANPIFSPPVASPTTKVITILPHPTDAVIRSINRGDWDAVIFAPGVHQIGKQLDIQTGEVFYIPGDAILEGTFLPNTTIKPQNIQIYGSGAISGEKLGWYTTNQADKDAMKVFTGNVGGARLEGFVVIDPNNHSFNMGNSGTVTNVYKNLKIFGWRKNGDGLNAFENSEVSDCFFRVQDDAFYLGYNVKIHHNTTWTDVNGAVMYLAKSDVNSYFKDIKVIYNRKKYHGWNSGVITMRDTDGNIENVLCQNINVEDPFPTVGLFYGTIAAGTYTFNNVVFDNITQDAMRQDGNKMDLLGTSPSRWKNITIKNSKYRGACLTSIDDGNWNYNTYVDKASIKFECSTSTVAVTGVTIDNCPSVGLPVNGTNDLSSTVLPINATNQGVTWTSSNPAIATIDASSGLVTAKAVGTATMTVKTSEGNFISTCTISVIAAPACSLPWSNADFTITNTSNSFTSNAIDISCASAVTISMDLSETDFFESTDKLTVSYKLNGGAPVLIKELINDFTSFAVNVPNLSGNTLEILINGVTNDAAEIYYIKNLKVTATTVAPAPNVIELTPWVSGTTNSKVSGTNRLMVVMVMGEHSADFSAATVTYGNQVMTKQAERMYAEGTSSRTYASIYTLSEVGVNAAVSGAISVTYNNIPAGSSPSGGSSVYSVLLGNVNQTTPVIGSVANSLAGTSISTSALLSASGDLLIYSGATGSNNTATPNNGFTETFESNTTWGDGVGGSKLSTGANEVPQFSQSASGRMVLCALVVKKSSGSTARVSQSKETLSVDEKLLSSTMVKVYPNPVSNILTIESNSKSEKEISVVNILGQVVFRTKSNSQNTQIDIQSLNVSGVVIVKVIADGNVSNHKVIVK